MNLKGRHIVLQYKSVPDDVERMIASKLDRIGFITEGEGKNLPGHIARAVAWARNNPTGTLAINCEHYGAENVEAAEKLVIAVRAASEKIKVGVYLTECFFPKWDALGQDPAKRKLSVEKVTAVAKRLLKAGVTFFCVDGYTMLGSPTDGGKDWMSSSWEEAWRTYVGQACTLIEPHGLPIYVWLCNRFVANGQHLPQDPANPEKGVEPRIPREELYRQYLFLEQRGWKSISLYGWSDTLWDRTKESPHPTGSLTFEDRDRTDLRTLADN